MSVPITAATTLILAENDADQAQALDAYSTGTIRKGLRHLALRFERADQQDLAREAWALRDALAEKTTTVEFTADDDFTALLAINGEAA